MLALSSTTTSNPERKAKRVSHYPSARGFHPDRPFNMDFSQAVEIHSTDQPWLPSPAKGVWRKPLEREGGEQGHATSLVRFEAGARFPAHYHPGGEEFLVLSGTFSDHTGDHVAGSYCRNPLSFRHAPHTKTGCDLLVKLHQFHAEDHAQLHMQTDDQDFVLGQQGLYIKLLHTFATEHVSLIYWPQAVHVTIPRLIGGQELFVIRGRLRLSKREYTTGTWSRLPHLAAFDAISLEDTVLWVKNGHLLRQ